MIRFLAQVSGLLIMLLGCTMASVTLLTSLTTANEIDQTRNALQSLLNCASPCLMGIEIGITSDEAINILNQNEWVGAISLEPFTMQRTGTNVTWKWSGRQPQFIDEEQDGFLQTELRGDSEVVVSISVEMALRFDDIYTILGTTEFGSLYYRDNRLGSTFISYSVAYNDSSSNLQISLETIIPCPATLLLYWNAYTEISLSSYTGTNHYSPPNELYQACNE